MSLQIDYSTFIWLRTLRFYITNINFCGNIVCVSCQLVVIFNLISTEWKIETFWDEANRTVSCAAKWHQSSRNISVMFSAQSGQEIGL